MAGADFTGKGGGGGFLSKVAKLVKGGGNKPVTNWGDLDNSIASSSINGEQFEVAYSKQAVKDMMDRKRHNDYIRKREFDALRKIRRRESGSGDGSLRPSFFVSSINTALPVEEREATRKKIDDIEEQMSEIWWKSKKTPLDIPAPAAKEPPQPSIADSIPASTINAFAPTEPLKHIPGDPMAYAPTAPLPPAPEPTQAAETPTPAAALPAALIPEIALAEEAPTPEPVSAAPEDSDSAAAGLAAESFIVTEHSIIHDAEIEEAAILFANGEDQAAEKSLLGNIQDSGTRQSHEPTWLALFDFYRATGQQTPFEQLAQHFVMRFQRSAPQWFSMPEILNIDPLQRSQAVQDRAYDWRAPATMSMQSVATMQAVLAKTPQPWRLDWSPLKRIEDDAVMALFILGNEWVNQPIELHFSGIASLEAALKQGTSDANKDTPQQRWQLRLLMMRLMQRDADFELLALDFCILYEVSPPTWERSQNKFKSLDAAECEQDVLVGDTVFDSLHGNNLEPQFFARVDLAGHIHGDASSTFALLDERRQGQNHLIIDCAKLMRIDFTAAGHILNWVIEKKAEGVRIQFQQAHRLVAALFDALGISEQVPVKVHAN